MGRDAPLLKEDQQRLKYEYCVVLRVRAPSWTDAVLSRFVSDDKRLNEGREKVGLCSLHCTLPARTRVRARAPTCSHRLLRRDAFRPRLPRRRRRR